MKHVRELVSEYIDEHREEFVRGEHGILIPEGTEAMVLEEWLQEGHAGSWAESLRGATKADVCANAEAVLMFLRSDETMEKIATCVDAFADWEKEWTPGPDVVLSCCEWMEIELMRRWREEGVLWPIGAVHLLFCKLGILAHHRLDAREAAGRAHGLVLNAACFFDSRKWEKP